MSFAMVGGFFLCIGQAAAQVSELVDWKGRCMRGSTLIMNSKVKSYLHTCLTKFCEWSKDSKYKIENDELCCQTDVNLLVMYVKGFYDAIVVKLR